jgi:predicted aspartyl protease
MSTAARTALVVVAFAGIGVGAACAVVRTRTPVVTASVFVVDVAAPAPLASSAAPTLRPHGLRGRIDRAPRPLVDGVDALPPPWVPVEDAATRGHVVVAGRTGDVDVRVVVDTAAVRTVVAPELAERLHLVLGAPVAPLRDAAGAVVAAREALLPPLDVAGARFVGLQVVVPGRSLRPDLFLLGLDALGHVDTWLDLHAGAIALVPAGGPLPDASDEADVVALSRDDDGRFVVAAAAPGAHGLAPFELLVDSASPLTAVPAAVGVRAGFSADVTRRATLRGAAGDGVERRGRFSLAPLSLGLLHVGPVAALETPDDRGTLGVDVLSRARVVISPSRSALFFFPVDTAAGPRLIDGAPVASVRAENDDHGTAIVVDVDDALLRAVPGGTRLFVRPFDGASGAPLGGVLEVTITHAGQFTLDVDLPLDAADVSFVVAPRALDDGDDCDEPCLRLFGDWGVPVR